MKTGTSVRKGRCLSPILFNFYSEYLNKEALEGFQEFKIGGQVIRTVKYADDLRATGLGRNGATGRD